MSTGKSQDLYMEIFFAECMDWMKLLRPMTVTPQGTVSLPCFLEAQKSTGTPGTNHHFHGGKRADICVAKLRFITFFGLESSY